MSVVIEEVVTEVNTPPTNLDQRVNRQEDNEREKDASPSIKILFYQRLERMRKRQLRLVAD